MPEEPKKPEAGAEPHKPSEPPQEQKKPDTNEGKRSEEMSAVAKEAERLQSAATQKPPADMTDRLSAADRALIPGFAGLAFGADPGAARFYRKLPLSLSTANLPPDAPRWRIEMEGLGPGVEPLGLDIMGDAVLGRGRVGNQPVDLDLDQYGGLEQGVSRRHALLRPTANHLYIIDLGSTNGTMHNGLPLGPGITRSLKHNDSITLGRLSFNIKIIDGPGYHKAAPPPSVEADSEPTRPLPKEGDAGSTADTQTRFPKITQDMIDARRKQLEAEQRAGVSTPAAGEAKPKPEEKSIGTDPLKEKPAAEAAKPKAEEKPAEPPKSVPDTEFVDTTEMPREKLFGGPTIKRVEPPPPDKPKDPPKPSGT